VLLFLYFSGCILCEKLLCRYDPLINWRLAGNKKRERAREKEEAASQPVGGPADAEGGQGGSRPTEDERGAIKRAEQRNRQRKLALLNQRYQQNLCLPPFPGHLKTDIFLRRRYKNDAGLGVQHYVDKPHQEHSGSNSNSDEEGDEASSHPEDSTQGNADALGELSEQALMAINRVESKLKGTDFRDDPSQSGGACLFLCLCCSFFDRPCVFVTVLNVQSQVDKLIGQATSNENLCQSYIGWCPFW
jgi:hypothetical protein